MKLPNWFTTMAPDFARHEQPAEALDFAMMEAEAQKLARPINANTQCGKLLAWLVEGHMLTPNVAMRICGGTEATRRLRELRRTLAAHGIHLDATRVKAGNTYVKQWRLAESEREPALKLLRGV